MEAATQTVETPGALPGALIHWVMLKKPEPEQAALEMVTLDELVPRDHLLLMIDAVIDFSFITIALLGFTARLSLVPAAETDGTCLTVLYIDSSHLKVNANKNRFGKTVIAKSRSDYRDDLDAGYATADRHNASLHPAVKYGRSRSRRQDAVRVQ